jgi:hypothetical protein
MMKMGEDPVFEEDQELRSLGCQYGGDGCNRVVYRCRASRVSEEITDD